MMSCVVNMTMFSSLKKDMKTLKICQCEKPKFRKCSTAVQPL